ncbi:MAG: hypothetical protein N2449_08165 [Bacteroidales bacterium]|nr:hypothetical protein [Bacteroidales bacterium]
MIRSLLLFLFIIFVISACQKDCKDCKSVTTDANGNVIQEGQANEYCDADLEQKENEPPVTIGDQTTKWVCE